jgi:hypothetical protein
MSCRRRAASSLTVATTLAVIATFGTLAAPAIQDWRLIPVHEGCDHTRHQLQKHADAYFLRTKSWPDNELAALTAAEYLGEPVMPCPTTGVRYGMSGSVVACQVHEPERER